MKALGLVGLAFAFLAWAAPAPACEADAPAAHGQDAYFDEATGRLSVPPEDFVAPARQGRAAEQPPLRLEPGLTDAGGSMIDLRGRYLYALDAVIAPDGTVVKECVRGSD